MLSVSLRVSGVLIATLMCASTGWSANICSRCKGTGKCQKMVPMKVTEMRTVTETCYREEQREEVKKIVRCIKVEKEVPYEYTAWVRVTKEDPQEIEIKTPKFRWVDQKYTINVPGKDKVASTPCRMASASAKPLRTARCASSSCACG